MKKIRTGIIGQGRSGHDIHFATIQKSVSDLFQVVAVADPLPLTERSRQSCEAAGATVYTDYREMLKRKDIELVVNASPSHLHVPITLEILDAGLNVLTEKPLARRSTDVDKLIAKAKASGKLFAVFQQSRLAPYFEKTREVVDSGVLGQIVLVKVAFNGFGRRWDWQTVQACSAGNLLNTGPHPLDQVLHFIGRDITPKVFCTMAHTDNSRGDAEDHAKLILTYPGRPTIDLEVSSLCAYPSHLYQVYGTRGGLAGSYFHLDWKYYTDAENPPKELSVAPLPDRPYCSETLVWHEEKWDATEEQKDFFFWMGGRFYRNLYDALVNGAPLVVKPEEVRQQVAIIEKAHRQNPLPKTVKLRRK